MINRIRILTLLLSVTLGLLFSSPCQGQLKYVGDSKGATMLSASYASSPTITTIEGEFDFTGNGHLGIGVSYAHAHDPQIDLIGIQAEFAILRPKGGAGVGANLDAAIAVTRATIHYPTVYLSGKAYPQPPDILNGRSAGLGAEVYLHTPMTDFRVEPFVQVSRTFASVTTVNPSPVTGVNSLAVGTDIIIASSHTNFVVFTIALLIQEEKQGAAAVNMSFVHAIK